MPSEIPFNKPFMGGKELHYIAQAVAYGNISSDGRFTKECERFIETEYQVQRAIMTPSCTAALEMTAILADLKPGDEVLLPSHTFVSTASAFARIGAVPVFVDIRPDTLNLDESLLERAITPRTKAVVPVHYAGVGCAMERINEIAEQHGLIVIEDAAQGVNASYRKRPLGSIGQLATYSFHETKNYICGEGGALLINDPRFIERAEILQDKGTDRKRFFRGEVDKYTWVDIGSSYVMSEISAAFLYAQFELARKIQTQRKRIYMRYLRAFEELEGQGVVQRPHIPAGCKSNYHMFYLLLPDEAARNGLIGFLKARGIHGVIHYVPLHNSPFARDNGLYKGPLPVTENAAARLLRLPFYCELSETDQQRVVSAVKEYLSSRRTSLAAASAPARVERAATA